MLSCSSTAAVFYKGVWGCAGFRVPPLEEQSKHDIVEEAHLAKATNAAVEFRPRTV